MGKINEKYKANSPLFWKNFGNALLGVSTILATYSITEEWGKYITITIIASGALGRFLTEFFGNDK